MIKQQGRFRDDAFLKRHAHGLCLRGSRGLVLLAVSLAALCGCSPARDAAVNLDKIALSIDQYGFASLSTPFLVGPNDGFGFDLNKDADFYFERAFQPQGVVRALSAEALDVQLAFRMNVEEAIATMAQYRQAKSLRAKEQARQRAAKQKALLESLMASYPEYRENALTKTVIGLLGVLAGEQPPADEEEPPADEGTAGADEVQPAAGDEPPEGAPTTQPAKVGAPIAQGDRLALETVGTVFTPAQTLPDTKPQISAREAIITASGDVMTQQLLSWFINPARNKQGDYELFFCPLIVSVQPGSRTRGGYVADITVNVDLARQTPDGGLQFLSECFPYSSPPIQVAGVFPVIDSQVLDLVSSRRKLFATAFNLAMLGFGSQADAFVDYAKKIEHDAKTQSALTAASAYTVGSTAFGFRVEPKFFALKNPADLESKPGHRLESRTFPAMAIILVQRSYLRHKDYRQDGTWQAGGDCPPEAPGEQKYKYTRLYGDGSARQVIESQRSDCRADCPLEQSGDQTAFDYLVFQTSTRWSPIGWSLPWARFSEVCSWERARALDKAEALITRLTCKGYRRQAQQLASRATALRKLGLDSQALVRVWRADSRPAKTIRVEAVHPRRGWLDRPTVVTIRGCGFEGNVDGVAVGGLKCEFQVLNDRTVVAVVPPWQEAACGAGSATAPGLPGWGEIAIAADVPVEVAKEAADGLPKTPPDGAGVPDVLEPQPSAVSLGWILFDRCSGGGSTATKDDAGGGKAGG
ncbi:MAG TPA: IPT/TIG domain-containing protein [Phycisphaerae bacterium]|nr:IPT/TIG domain-containing protein [Phycisphaerae bacterium]